MKLTILACAVALAACAPQPPVLREVALYSPLPALPEGEGSAEYQERLALYGRALFFATDLSFDRRRSCASCHRPSHGFAGPLPTDTQLYGPRDVPTLRGVTRRASWMWSGSVGRVEDAALHAFGDDDMFGGTTATSLRQLTQVPGLAAQHTELFGRPPSIEGAEPTGDTLEEVAQALVAYLRQLDAGGSRFDEAAQRPMEEVLAADARRGYELFHGRLGCVQCHSGPNFTDDELRDLGLPKSDVQIGLDPDDPLARLEAGRRDANVTLVRTPSLRDVATRPPYMHDGRFETLTDAVRFYSETVGSTPEARALGVSLRPLGLSEREIADVVAFLGSLTSAEVGQGWRTAPPKPAAAPAPPPRDPRRNRPVENAAEGEGEQGSD